MDKETYDALKAILVPYFLAGGTRANALEAVRAAELDATELSKDKVRQSGADLATKFPVTPEYAPGVPVPPEDR